MSKLGSGMSILVVASIALAVGPERTWAQAPAAKPSCGGAGVCKKSWYGGYCPTCYAHPYHTSSCLYGYQDYVYGRGPLINLGGSALEPGFRGYGVIGSPGYGLGLRPSSVIDAQANERGLKFGHK